MSGLPNFNYPAFNQEAQRLRAAGIDVRNPAEAFGGKQDAGDWAFYLRHGLKSLLDCDAVAALPGWRRSRGAQLEIHVALQLGMEVRPSKEYG